MKKRYGLLGARLGHSFSKVIHERITGDNYDLIPLTEEEFDAFVPAREYAALNVTLPYKQRVIPFLDEVDERAAAIGAVNTVVNREGKLYGYNTDFDGVLGLMRRNGVDPAGKTVLILGTGGTHRTVTAVLRYCKAGEILVASRTGKNGALTYPQAMARKDVQIIINTTPCGMYPHVEDCPIELAGFPRLEAVLDVVYNPLRTRLVQNARALGITAEGGLYMLVEQAVCACERFYDKPLGSQVTDEIFGWLAGQKTNIVLTGMPGAGKSHIGRLLAEATGRALVDLDEEIVKTAGMPISEIFAKEGEAGFRDRETAELKKAAAQSGQIIATGGGAILRDENIAALKQNGLVFFIDRPLEALQTGHGRPLSADFEAVKKRYGERYDRYLSTADIQIENTGTPEEAALKIKEAMDAISGT